MGEKTSSLENLAMNQTLNFAGIKVLLTGHTGFKGGWLASILKSLDANVYGLSLEPEYENGSYALAGKVACYDEKYLDINQLPELIDTVHQVKPDLILHLAAQALVRKSYMDPIATFATNAMGTANVLEAARREASVRAVIVVTTDKCYWNNEWTKGYKEDDRLGGKDPYSASKACAELITESYVHSYFPEKSNCWVASARAGNVVGGADWAEDRLIPDLVRSRLLSVTPTLRNPQSIRPWQHVLDPLWGYLMLAERLLSRKSFARGAWNFGPSMAEGCRTVKEMADLFAPLIGAPMPVIKNEPNANHEAGLLMLDASKAQTQLKWTPLLGFQETITWTAEWYRNFVEGGVDAGRRSMQEQIDRYIELRTA